MKKLFQKLSLLFVAAYITVLPGCGAISQYKSLPPEQRADFVKQKAVEFLSDSSHQATFENALVFAGNRALAMAVSDSERQQIADEMYAVSVAFHSLANGAFPTPQQVTDTLKSFASHIKGEAWSDYVAAVGIIWAGVFGNLQISQSAQLGIDYLNLFANAAIRVGEGYRTATS